MPCPETVNSVPGVTAPWLVTVSALVAAGQTSSQKRQAESIARTGESEVARPVNEASSNPENFLGSEADIERRRDRGALAREDVQERRVAGLDGENGTGRIDEVLRQQVRCAEECGDTSKFDDTGRRGHGVDVGQRRVEFEVTRQGLGAPGSECSLEGRNVRVLITLDLRQNLGNQLGGREAGGGEIRVLELLDSLGVEAGLQLVEHVGELCMYTVRANEIEWAALATHGKPASWSLRRDYGLGPQTPRERRPRQRGRRNNAFRVKEGFALRICGKIASDGQRVQPGSKESL